MSEEKITNSPQDKDVESNKTIAALSYVWILFLLPLLNNKKSKFAQFHAKQGFVLFILSLFTIVPFFGQILGLVLLVVSIIGFVKTVNGEWWKTPIIYDWSKKVNI